MTGTSEKVYRTASESLEKRYQGARYQCRVMRFLNQSVPKCSVFNAAYLTLGKRPFNHVVALLACARRDLKATLIEHVGTFLQHR